MSFLIHLVQGPQTHVHRGPHQRHGRPLKGPETLYKLLEHIIKYLFLHLIILYLSLETLYIRKCV